MRKLLDENFPTDFAKLLAGHDVSSVHSLGWSGIKNGELLRRAGAVCEVFVTLDQNLEFQQNIKALPFGVVVCPACSSGLRQTPNNTVAGAIGIGCPPTRRWWADSIGVICRPVQPDKAMNEIVFSVEQAPEGGFIARALGHSIFTEGETEQELREMVRDAVRCHFDEDKRPAVIRLHFVRDEVLAA